MMDKTDFFAKHIDRLLSSLVCRSCHRVWIELVELYTIHCLGDHLGKYWTETRTPNYLYYLSRSENASYQCMPKDRPMILNCHHTCYNRLSQLKKVYFFEQTCPRKISNVP